jgi:hypothetical protein
VIIFNEAALYRQMKSFADYYHRSRTHLSLSKDSPESRAVQSPELGRIVSIPQVGVTATSGAQSETLALSDCPLINPAPLHNVPSFLRTTSWPLMPALDPYISSLQAKRCVHLLAQQDTSACATFSTGTVAFTTPKIAVLAPIPSAKVSNTIAVMRGDFHMLLNAKRTSCHRFMRPPGTTSPMVSVSCVPSWVGKRFGVSLAAKNMASRETEFFENIGLLDDDSSRLGSALSASHHVIRLPATANLAIVAALIQIPLIRTGFSFSGLPSCPPVARLRWMRRAVIASAAARSRRGAPT